MGMSVDDIAKLKDKAAAFHPKMFENFLYRKFAATDTTFSALDQVMKFGRKAERMAANAQYTLFYSIF